MGTTHHGRSYVVFVLALFAGCAFAPGLLQAGDSMVSPPPTVLSNTPSDDAVGVPLRGSVISATFSTAMDPSTITSSTFTLTSGTAATPVDGTVTYGDSRVVFEPTADLASDARFTATITTMVLSANGVALVEAFTWSFTGDAVAAGPPPVLLGNAINYCVLAKAGISGIGATIVGDLGVSPIVATAITGFSLVADGSNTFSRSSQVTGKVYAKDYAAPTPMNLATAVLEMEAAYIDAAARPVDFDQIGAGAIGGLILPPGVYNWTTALSIPTDVTLIGGSKAVWIFQITQDLTIATNAHTVLTGGALAKNVFWAVKGAVTLGTMAHLDGVLLGKTAVTLAAGVTVNGRLLVQTFANTDGSTVTQPGL